MALPAEWQWIEELLTSEGRTVSLRKPGTVKDAAKPWRGNSAGDSVSTSAVLVKYRRNEIDNDHIKRTDMKAFVAPYTGEDIEEFSTFIDADSSVWNIEDVEKIQPGSDILLYILQLRR